MSEFNLDIQIDIHSLDFEWERQASLVQKYSSLFSDATTLRDEAKEESGRVDGEIDFEVRNDYESYGFESKPTEAAIKSTVINDDRHIKAAKKVIELNREVMVLHGVKTALEHKKAALERLTSLYLSGYWADPKIRGEAKTAYESGSGQDAHRSHLANNNRIGGKRHGKEE